MNNKLLLVDRLEQGPEVGEYETGRKALNIDRDGGFEGNVILRQRDERNMYDVFQQFPWVGI